MNIQIKKQIQKQRRKNRVHAVATEERPRLSVFRSLNSISAQIINGGKTLVSASSREVKEKKNKTEAAAMVGKILSEKALQKGIKKVVFDRGSFQYHGRIKALADSAREGGLQF